MAANFFLRTIVGLIVGVSIGAVITGQNMLAVLVMAIICTCGLSLIVIIPVAYLIGLLCTFWFLPFAGEPEGGGTLNSGTPEVGTTSYIQRAALEKFIKNHLKRGNDLESIRNVCRSEGWSEDSIQDAIDAIQTQKEISAW